MGNSKTPRVRAACKLSAAETRTLPQTITAGAVSARSRERTWRPRQSPGSGGATRILRRSVPAVRSHRAVLVLQGRGDRVRPCRTRGAAARRNGGVGTASRQADPRTARARGPRRRRGGAGRGKFQSRVVGAGGWCPGGMRLHCEVEVVSRHLPALGMRNRGKGVRAVLSLCQQAPRTPPGPRAGGERGGRHPACLFISTLKDKRGTRYEVRGAGGSGVAARRSCPKRPTVSPAGLRLGGSRAPGP